MKRRILAGLLSLCLIGSGFPMQTWAGTETISVLESEKEIEKEIYVSDGNVMTKLYSGAYLSQYRIPVSSYECVGGNPGGLNYAFDDDWNTQWTAYDLGEASITVTFESIQSVSRILYGLRERLYDPDGYPTDLRIEFSTEETGENFRTVGSVTSEPTLDKVLFTLEETVEARRVRFVFEKAHEIFAKAGELIFLKEDSVMTETERLFENPQTRQLREEYKDDAVLNRLEEEAKDHIARTYLLPKIRLAKQILTGEVEADDPMDFPVRVIQKTGSDAESYNILIVPDRFTVDQQEEFYQDIRRQMNQMMETYEPYREFADKINIYALEVPSNERDASVSTYSWSVDSYFGTLLDSSGSDVSMRLPQNGQEKLAEVIQQMDEHYLDEGGKVNIVDISLNSTLYAGTAFRDKVPYSIQTVNGYYSPYLMYHEFSHSVGSLGDEYSSSHTIECDNVTTNSNPQEAPWKEFLYFRGVTHYPIQTGLYRSSARCQMAAHYWDPFCEWCTLLVFESLNRQVGEEVQEDIYIAQPVFTVDHTDTYSGLEILPENIVMANGKEVRFRTVVKNLTQEPKVLKMEMCVQGADGTEREQVFEEYTIGGGEIKSLTLDGEVMQNLQANERFLGRIIDTSNQQVLVSTDTYLVPETYANVQVNFRLGKPGQETDIPLENVSDYKLNLQVGSEVEVEPISLKGYEHQTVTVVSDKGSEILSAPYQVSSREKITITHYYTKEKGKVTLRLTNGEGIADKERYIEVGETFYPSQSDFPEKQGYYLKLPEAATFDGLNESRILEYTYVQGENPGGEQPDDGENSGGNSGENSGETPEEELPDSSEVPDGRNLENLNFKFQTVEDTEVTSAATGGKPKILIFFNDNCVVSQLTIQDINNLAGTEEGSWFTEKKVDVYAIEMTNASKEQVKAFADTYAPGGYITMCHNDANYGIYRYAGLWVGEETASAGSLPMIVMIDSNNRVQYRTNGRTYGGYLSLKVPNLFVKVTNLWQIAAETDILTFDSVEEGYSEVNSKTIVIKNTGNQSVTLTQPTAQFYELGTLSKTILEPGENAEFTIQPKAGLLGKETPYEETITIQGSGNALCTVKASVQVEKPKVPLLYPITIEIVGNGSVDSSHSSASAGTRVTLTPQPAAGYEFEEWKVLTGNVAIEENAFTMPEGEVRMQAIFEKLPNKEPEEDNTQGENQKPEEDNTQGENQKPEEDNNQDENQKPEEDNTQGENQKPEEDNTQREEQDIIQTKPNWKVGKVFLAGTGSSKGYYKITKLSKKSQKPLQVTYVAPANKKIKKVTIPKKIKIKGISCTVVAIASNAFNNSKTLQTVVIGDTVKTIGNNAFANCKKLKKVTMGKGITSIGTKAFFKCTFLKNITIPAKVSKIGKQAFYGCKKLNKITFKTAKLKKSGVGKNAFAGISKKVKLRAPGKKAKLYKNIVAGKGI